MCYQMLTCAIACTHEHSLKSRVPLYFALAHTTVKEVILCDDHFTAPPVSPRVFPAALVEDELPGDLFSVIFKADCHSSSWRALLAHAIALQRPLLAILSACYKVTQLEKCLRELDCTHFGTLNS